MLYSGTQGADVGTNCGFGEYKNSGLADVWRAVVQSNAVRIVDMAPYAPAGNEPAMFVGAPVHNETEELVGVVVGRLSVEPINHIMQVRDGMGETGESYLVGADMLMRSDSYLDPQGHSVRASLTGTVAQNGVNTEAIRQAMSGLSGCSIIMDYNGNPVLSCYDTLEIDGFSWVTVSEIDVAEALCPKDGSGKYFFEKYTEMYGYYDLFLINPDGFCFYTVCRESDYKTNFVNGKFADSGLGEAVRESLATKKLAFGDFAPYAPSNGAPAAFLTQPVMYDGQVTLVVGLQLSDGAISSMMAMGSSREKTLESYLVGPNGYMRSNSILNPDQYSIVGSFRNNNRCS